MTPRPALSAGPTVPAPTSAAPTIAPTPTVTATPVAVLPTRGTEVFDPGQGTWTLAASSDDFGGGAHGSVDHLAGDIVEAWVACTGTGTVHVTIVAVKNDVDPSVPLVDEVIECPSPLGQPLSMSGVAPAGWSVNADGAPSDDSIRYQVLVGTIVP